jgi:predicted site-specific integrase-resolvase
VFPGARLQSIAYNRTASRAKASITHVGSSLKELVRRKVTMAAHIRDWRERYQLVTGLDGLARCGLIVETINENPKCVPELEQG